jgi:hypothetical protein
MLDETSGMHFFSDILPWVEKDMRLFDYSYYSIGIQTPKTRSFTLLRHFLDKALQSRITHDGGFSNWLRWML